MLVEVADDTRIAQRETNEDSSLSVALAPGERRAKGPRPRPG